MNTPSNPPGIDVDSTEYMVYNPQHWLKRIQERIENSPFKGYLEVHLNLSGVPYLLSIVSPLRWDNREKAYLYSFVEIDDMVHEAWLAKKASIGCPCI